MVEHVSLYQLEDDLVAMLNSIDMVEDPEARAAVEQQIIDQHLKAIDKRDKVSQFLAHCDNQEEFISTEIERLVALRKHFTAARDRVENYVIFVIKALGQDDRGKWRKLDGKTCSFSIANKPPSTEITSLDALPDQYKDLTVKLEATDWTNFLNELGLDERQDLLRRLKSIEASARKADIKKALSQGDVTGARLSEESYRLNRK
jgi:hypothetical protein